MIFRELESIEILKKIEKYRKISLIKVIIIISRIGLLPVVCCLIVIFFVRFPDGVKCEGYFEQPNKIQIFSKVNAQISEVFVQNGSKVKQGQPLLIFNSNEIYSSFIKQNENMIVASNQLISTEIQIKSFIIEWKIEYRQKEREFIQKTKLYEKGLCSFEEYELAKNSFELAKLSMYKLIQLSNELINTIKRIESIILERDVILDFLSNTSVISPIEGIVIFDDDKYVKGYETFKGEKIFEILPDEKVIAKLFIPEKSASKVRTNQKVIIYPAAFPKERYRGLEGVLFYLSPNAVSGVFLGKVRLKSGTVKVKVDGKWIEKSLSYGMTLKAKIITRKRPLYEFLLGINEDEKVNFIYYYSYFLIFEIL
ncbi:MAG: HlyD family secretion protein [Brevinematia bacterium]